MRGGEKRGEEGGRGWGFGGMKYRDYTRDLYPNIFTDTTHTYTN